MVWDPTRIVPRPWEDVVGMYRQMADRNDEFRPLLQLAEYVASQAYARSIFAATSGTALLVARQATVDWAAEALRVDVSLSGTIRLTQPEKALVKAATFECEAEKIVAVFERHLGLDAPARRR